MSTDYVPKPFPKMIYRDGEQLVVADKDTMNAMFAEGWKPYGHEGAVDPLDHDGDGKPGGSTKTPVKDALIKRLEGAGVSIDKRWGESRLKRLVDNLTGKA